MRTPSSVVAPVDAEAEEVWRGLLVWFESVAAAVERELTSGTGLSTADFQVLERLRQASDGAMNQSDLIDVLRWSPSRLSHQLTRMKSRGYLRTDLQGSGTRRLVVLTAEGRSTIDAALPSHAEAVRRHLLDTITPRHRAELAAAVARAMAGTGTGTGSSRRG